MTREELFRYFFFGLFIFLFIQLLRVFSPFFPAFLWAATLTLIFYPLHARFQSRLRAPVGAAVLSTLAALALAIAPLAATAGVLFRESVHLYPAAKVWIAGLRQGTVQEALPALMREGWRRADDILEPAGLSLEGFILANLDQITRAIGENAARITKGLLMGLMNFALMAATLYFFFRHGLEALEWLVDLVPMSAHHKRRLLAGVSETFAAVVRGLLAGAAIQGALAGVGFALAGVAFPVFFGAACAFASLLPFVGSSIVWGPVGAFLLARGEPSGAFLIVWGFLVLGLRGFMTRLLAPPLSRVPVLLALFAMLGGIRLYGVNGVLLGPLILAFLLSFVRVYREEFPP